MTVRTMQQTEADLRAALTILADRWHQMAINEEASIPHLQGPAAEQVGAQIHQRVTTYRKAAADVRDVLRTGRIPHDLMTDAELEQHGTPAAE
ncbi:hypothetical protein OIE75_29375 [Streptomyces sp. NBC_01723]|uniref:hypothetical protein n=1 Tax=Streptomyces sp. NBC_01723 TaxID=2975921 RepID=UPI002E34EB2D|nr:hypothetical protein [Streptomyces sp. NBC_01723]